LISLLAACFIFFVEEKIEAFVPEVRSFAEVKMENILDGRVKLSIGSLDGGILHPITANDIKIRSSEADAMPYVTISNIKTNYRIWDVVFPGKHFTAIPSLLSGLDSVNMNFSTANNEASGFIRLENSPQNLKVTGSVNLLYEDRVDFTALVKNDTFSLMVRPGRGIIRAEGKVSDDGELTVNFKATHLILGGFDIVCDGIIRNRILSKPDGSGFYIKGELETKNLMVNYKPFLGVKMSYKICDGVLEVPKLELADSFRGNGKFTLSRPHNINFLLTANNVNIGWLLASLGVNNASSILTGTMNAKFELNGPLAKARSNVQLDIRKGTVATLDFDYLSVHFKGDGPMIRIEDSRITRPSGYFVLKGEIDLSKMGKGNIFGGVLISSDDNAITWDGWNMTKTQDEEEVRMEKRLNDDLNIDFKKVLANDRIDESLRNTDEVGLEYKLHSNDSLKLSVGAEKDFFGFEHKDKF
jgi:hypothetical protein